MKVSVVEDNSQITNYLRSLFWANDEFHFLESYPNAKKAINGMPAKVPDIAIVDLGLPDRHGAECIRELKKKIPEFKVIVFTVLEDEQNILRAIRAGANGYLLRDTPAELFLLELKVTMQGGGGGDVSYAQSRFQYDGCF